MPAITIRNLRDDLPFGAMVEGLDWDSVSKINSRVILAVSPRREKGSRAGGERFADKSEDTRWAGRAQGADGHAGFLQVAHRPTR